MPLPNAMARCMVRHCSRCISLNSMYAQHYAKLTQGFTLLSSVTSVKSRDYLLASAGRCQVRVMLAQDSCALQKRSPLSDSFPAGSQAAARDLADFAAPLILARVLRAAVRIARPEKKPKGIRRSISESGEADGFFAVTSLSTAALEWQTP